MIATDKAEGILLDILGKAGVSIDNIDGKTAWHIFKEFASIEFDCVEDLLLWETGIFSSRNERYFFCSMSRQFAHEEYMEQLHMEFHFNSDEVLAAFKSGMWSEDYNTLTDFFNAVEHSQAFVVPFTNYMPIKFRLYFDQL